MPDTIFLSVRLATLAVACWIVHAIPLRAQPLLIADDNGVTVNLNGSQLIHRSPIHYPADALTNGIRGIVVARLNLNANGEVLDAILDGPAGLAASARQSLLTWHFDKSAAATTRVVNIDFAKPPEGSVPLAFNPSDPLPARTTTLIEVTTAPLQAPAPGGTGLIDQIDVTGLSDQAVTELLARFPVHPGDLFNATTLARATDAARDFDPHLTVGIANSPAGMNVMSIGLSVFNEKPSILVSAERSPYPALAKMARQQGTVIIRATVQKDGAVKDATATSGPPLLLQPAMQTVKTWVCQPTLLNGAPVETVRTINVLFTLPKDPDPAPSTLIGFVSLFHTPEWGGLQAADGFSRRSVHQRGGPPTNPGLHKPARVRRVNQHLRTGHCEDADELTEKAVHRPAAAARRLMSVRDVMH